LSIIAFMKFNSLLSFIFFWEYSPPIFIYTKLWKQRLKDVYLCHTSIYATLDKEISPQAKLEHYNNCVYEIKKKS
jgi:hypothetical protein